MSHRKGPKNAEKNDTKTLRVNNGESMWDKREPIKISKAKSDADKGTAAGKRQIIEKKTTGLRKVTSNTRILHPDKKKMLQPMLETHRSTFSPKSRLISDQRKPQRNTTINGIPKKTTQWKPKETRIVVASKAVHSQERADKKPTIRLTVSQRHFPMKKSNEFNSNAMALHPLIKRTSGTMSNVLKRKLSEPDQKNSRNLAQEKIQATRNEERKGQLESSDVDSPRDSTKQKRQFNAGSLLSSHTGIWPRTRIHENLAKKTNESDDDLPRSPANLNAKRHDVVESFRKFALSLKTNTEKTQSPLDHPIDNGNDDKEQERTHQNKLRQNKSRIVAECLFCLLPKTYTCRYPRYKGGYEEYQNDKRCRIPLESEKSSNDAKKHESVTPWSIHHDPIIGEHQGMFDLIDLRSMYESKGHKSNVVYLRLPKCYF